MHRQSLRFPAIITILVFLVFATVFCLVSLVNHYQLRTYGADLGLFNHALWSYSHFKADYITLHFRGDDPAFLGDHFSPLVMLFVPFYWLFGSYALLIVQILSILAGGLGIFLFVRDNTRLSWMPLLILLHFFCLWALYSALSFDFHTNVVGAMMIPWFILFYSREQKKRALLLFALILLAKESMPLWMAFIIPALMWMNRKSFRQYLRFEIPLIAFSLFYFILVLGYVMPWLQQGKGTEQISHLYANLGGSIPEMIRNIFLHPRIIIDALFHNTSKEPLFDGIKWEFHLMMLVSGGLALLVRPAWLFMLIPIYAQKFLTDNSGLWGINNHYSIEFAPILSMALFDSVKRIPNRWITLGLTAFFVLSSGLFTYLKMEDRKSVWYNKANNAFYSKEHFDPVVNLDAVYNILQTIPANASLSVSTELAPRLAFRDKIYHFPVIKDADMIVIFSDKKGDYPLNKEQRMQIINQLIQSGQYTKTLDRDDILILTRVKPPHPQ
ncbi:MAG: DUF2079 domain-containing protein [Bacteroidetes bacterium]|nr:DUF2079 domain-containing protein [Bacteroidota bacterium]